uniref:Male-enhanced antigen 1 n=1 Tax=Graphocephala atropunctata TaxID=36148 RepID=A0A1B6LUE6_9HEMI
MVCNWSPDPPRDVDDRMSVPSQVVAVESDDSEEEAVGNAPPGYELLPQGPAVGVSSDEEEESDTEASAEADPSSRQPTEPPSTPEALARRRSEVEEVDQLYSTPALRPEMAVDCDQVRAAMSGFSLPPSAFPPWAAGVPEVDWATVLTQHIQRIQAGHRDAQPQDN